MERLHNPNTELLKLRLPKELKDYVQEQAQAEGGDMSKLMRKMISDYRKKSKRAKK